MVPRLALFFACGFLLGGCGVDENGSDASVSPPAVEEADGSAADLHRAIAQGDLSAVRGVLRNEPGRIDEPNGRNPPLLSAILRKQPEIALFLIEEGADVRVVDTSGRTAAHLAVERDLPELIPPLAAAGAPLSELDRVGWTPLHWAAAKDNLVMARALVESGAALSKRSKLGGTVLHEAASTGGAEMVQLFLDLGVDPTLTANDGGTALDVAREFGNAEAVRILENQE